MIPAPAMEGLKPAISLSDNALKHLSKMRSERGEDLCLRIGVKQGGCSGMSYTMDFENRANARPDDSTIEYEGFTIVCDPKSMVFLFGSISQQMSQMIGAGKVKEPSVISPGGSKTEERQSHDVSNQNDMSQDGGDQPHGEVNMEASISAEDVIRAGGFGAKDDIGSFLPVASDSTDFEESIRYARDYEEPQPEVQRPGLGWPKE